MYINLRLINQNSKLKHHVRHSNEPLFLLNIITLVVINTFIKLIFIT